MKETILIFQILIALMLFPIFMNEVCDPTISFENCKAGIPFIKYGVAYKCTKLR